MSKALVRQGELDLFPIFTEDPGNLVSAFEENLGGQGLSAFDLPALKVPSSAGKHWSSEDEDPVKEIVGIIIWHRLTRSFWEQSIDEGGGGSQPDCFSDDSVNGIGNPGGSCATCAYSKFGSGKDGRGQKCQQRHQIFVLRENEILPTLISLPPMSLKPMKTFLLRLASQRKPYYSVVVSLGLSQGRSKSGFDFSAVKPKVVAALDEEKVAAVQAYAEKMRPSLASVRDDDAGAEETV